MSCNDRDIEEPTCINCGVGYYLDGRCDHCVHEEGSPPINNAAQRLARIAEILGPSINSTVLDDTESHAEGDDFTSITVKCAEARELQALLERR